MLLYIYNIYNIHKIPDIEFGEKLKRIVFFLNYKEKKNFLLSLNGCIFMKDKFFNELTIVFVNFPFNFLNKYLDPFVFSLRML